MLSALILFRSVHLLRTRRMWGEEGAVYLPAAWQHGASSLLLPHLGYYSLLPNVAAYIASWLPLSLAPVPFMISGFVAMLGSVTVVLTSRSSLFHRNWVRLVAAAGLVFVPAATGEIWLNSINAQTFLTVAAFVIMLEPRPRAVHVAALAVAGLTAPSVTFLLPLLLLRFLVEANRYRGLPLLGAGGMCAAIQLLAHRAAAGDRPMGSGNGFTTWMRFVEHVFVPVSHSDSFGVVAAGVLALIALLAIAVGFRGHPGVIIGIACSSWLFVLNTEFSLRQSGGSRYWYAPSVILLMTMLFAVGLRNVSSGHRLLAGILCAVLLLGGVNTYFTRMRMYADPSWSGWTSEAQSACKRTPAVIYEWPQHWGTTWLVKVPAKICARQ